MIKTNRMLSHLVLLSISFAMPLFGVANFPSTLRDLTTSRKVGQDNAMFFINTFSQTLPEGSLKNGNLWIALNTIYKNAHEIMPSPSSQNGIWLNQNGKVLYRVPKGNYCSCLLVYDAGRQKHTEIARYHNVKYHHLPPYRLNNKNEIFYFEHSAQQKWVGYIMAANRQKTVVLDQERYETLGNPYHVNYSDFLHKFGSEMDKGHARVDFNDLGQILFASGSIAHQTWLIDPKHSQTQFWDMPYKVTGLNRSGDIFLHSALSKGAVYHSTKQKLFTFDTTHTSHDFVISNELRSAIFPADQLCDPFAGKPHLYLAGDHARPIESFDGHKLFFQEMNDRADAAGFGALSLLYPNFKLGYIKGVTFSVTDGVKELEDFGDRRSAVLGINNHGALAGFAETNEGKLQAFVKNGPKVINIGAHFSDSSLALSVNDQDWVVGIYKDERGLFQGFLFHPKKGVVNIAHGLNEHYNISFNIPIGFNEKGQVVGILYFVKDNAIHRTAFTYDPENGSAVHLPHYPHEEVSL